MTLQPTKITIQLKADRGYIPNISYDLFDILDEEFSAYVEGYQFSPKYKQFGKNGKRIWDGKTHFFSRATNSFPVGLLSDVVNLIKSLNYEISVKILEKPNIPTEHLDQYYVGFSFPEKLGKFTYRDYQKEAGTKFLTYNSLIPYSGILQGSVSSGKTALSAGIAHALNTNTLFVVHGRALVTQAYNVYLECFGEDKVGIITAKEWNPKQITIASIDTLYSYLKKDDVDDSVLEFLANVVFLVLDEAHHATNKVFRTVMKCLKPVYKLALSGTPLNMKKDHDLLLKSLVGPIFHVITTTQLQEQGFIADAELKLVTVEEPKFPNLSYHEAFNACLLKNKTRTDLIARLALDRASQGKRVLILAGIGKSVAYAHAIREALPADRDDIEVLTGAMGEEAINASFDSLRTGKISILIVTQLADEGVDIPDVNVVILGAGGKSFTKAIQRIGRGLRKKRDNSVLEFIDFYDLTNKYLEKHSKKRLEFYYSENIFKEATLFSTAEEINELCNQQKKNIA